MKKISQKQLLGLLWAGSLAPAAEWLPGAAVTAAGKGAWLSLLPAGVVLWGAGRWTARAVHGRDLAAALKENWGQWPLLLYTIWGTALLTLRLRLSAQRFYAGGEGRDGSAAFFLLVLAGVLLWMGWGELPALGRAGGIALAALLLGGAAVVGLSLPQLKPEWLLPLALEESGGILWGAVPTAGVLGWSFFAAFLLGDTEQEEDGEKIWRRWVLGGCALLSLCQLVILGVLGAPLAAQVESPFFLLAKGASVPGGFQRGESLVAALWLFSDLTQGGVVLFGLKQLWLTLLPERGVRLFPWAAVLPAAAAALLPCWDGAALKLWGGTLLPAGNLILGAALLPLLAKRGKPLGA